MLDGYESYRLEPGHELFDLQNVILTPHFAGMTRESRTRMGVGRGRGDAAHARRRATEADPGAGRRGHPGGLGEENPERIDADGSVWPPEKPGLGVEVDEEFIDRHPAIEGPGYI